jgi:hypothetical protein
MKEDMSPEVQKTAVRKAMIANLEKAVLGTETCIKSLRCFEKADAVRIEYDTGLTILASGAQKNSTALLYEVIDELHKRGEADLARISCLLVILPLLVRKILVSAQSYHIEGLFIHGEPA